MKHAIISLAVASVFLSNPLSAGASPGDLDTAFGDSGFAVERTIGPLDQIEAVALQSDGRIVVNGTTRSVSSDGMTIARFTSAGHLDTTFSNIGKQTMTFRIGIEAYGRSLVIQPDGNIVAAATSFDVTRDFGLARFLPGGQLDPSFNVTGTALADTGGEDLTSDVALQPDGKFVLTGTSEGEFAVMRFNADGSLDAGFGGGIVITPIGSAEDASEAVALQPDGKAVVAGSTNNGPGFDVALVRYNADGSLDAGFGSGGIVVTPAGAFDDEGKDVVIQPDGKIVVAGSSFDGVKNDFSVIRYNADGSLDSSFNGSGIVTTDFGDASEANALFLQADGKIIAAGQASNGANFDFAVARYNADGSLDTTFGAGGLVTIPVGGSSNDVVSDLAVREDGRIILAGHSVNDYTLARLLGNTANLALAAGVNGGAVVSEGDTASFSLTVTNQGPDDAPGARLAHALPAGFTVDAASVASSQGSCTVAADIACDLGPIANGASVTVTYSALAGAAGVSAVNARVDARQADDPQGADNSVAASFAILTDSQSSGNPNNVPNNNNAGGASGGGGCSLGGNAGGFSGGWVSLALSGILAGAGVVARFQSKRVGDDADRA